jgi:hypothetical protein
VRVFLHNEASDMFANIPLRVATLAFVATQLISPPLYANNQSTRASAAGSGLSILGSAITASATVKLVETTVASGGRLVVSALEPVADGLRVSFRAVGASVDASATAVVTVGRDASLAVGTVVSIAAEATGYALVTAGRIIAFIPNELGQSLLRQERSRYAAAARE